MKKTSKAVRTHKHSFRRYTAGMLAALMILGGIDPAGISTIITMAQEAAESGKIAAEPAELEESVLKQTLPLGAVEKDIFFPDSVYVTIVEEETGDSSAEKLVISTKDSVKDSEEGSQDSPDISSGGGVTALCPAVRRNQMIRML